MRRDELDRPASSTAPADGQRRSRFRSSSVRSSSARQEKRGDPQYPSHVRPTSVGPCLAVAKPLDPTQSNGWADRPTHQRSLSPHGLHLPCFTTSTTGDQKRTDVGLTAPACLSPYRAPSALSAAPADAAVSARPASDSAQTACPDQIRSKPTEQMMSASRRTPEKTERRADAQGCSW